MEEDDLSPRRQTPSSDNNQDLNEYGLPKSEFEKFITKRPGAVIGSTSSLNNKKGALKRRDLEKKKKQVKPGRPWFLWIVSLIQLGVFIAEIVFNWKWGGKVISDPSVNPLIGPGVGVKITLENAYTRRTEYCSPTSPSI